MSSRLVLVCFLVLFVACLAVSIDRQTHKKAHAHAEYEPDVRARIQSHENSKGNPHGGWNESKQKWYPHASIEGGLKTIAWGHKCKSAAEQSKYEDDGLTDAQAEALLTSDLQKAAAAADKLIPPEQYPITAEARSVLVEMCFGMGSGGAAKFQNMMNALKNYDYSKAADELMDSQWGRQGTKGAREMEAVLRGQRAGATGPSTPTFVNEGSGSVYTNKRGVNCYQLEGARGGHRFSTYTEGEGKCKRTTLLTCDKNNECEKDESEPCQGTCYCNTHGVNSCDCYQAFNPSSMYCKGESEKIGQ